MSTSLSSKWCWYFMYLLFLSFIYLLICKVLWSLGLGVISDKDSPARASKLLQSLLLPTHYSPATLAFFPASGPLPLTFSLPRTLILLIMHLRVLHWAPHSVWLPLTSTVILLHFLSHHLVLFSLWQLSLSDIIWHCFTHWIISSMETQSLSSCSLWYPQRLVWSLHRVDGAGDRGRGTNKWRMKNTWPRAVVFTVRIACWRLWKEKWSTVR